MEVHHTVQWFDVRSSLREEKISNTAFFAAFGRLMVFHRELHQLDAVATSVAEFERSPSDQYV
jgi:hypothetical protein